eukprot:CAMPEP_0194026980 /NCGR_PEP_ID=MMETSP0009_2-20130614/1222_1 /TAXON_ID=210454 /ORGANISM="Grammatophora oceanica, Strain CCMP 410" /LENGTH=45 /DNA_ID= /DNA_START= /DNA_END= /DNA_ORIENTATION=
MSGVRFLSFAKQGKSTIRYQTIDSNKAEREAVSYDDDDDDDDDAV